jgi:hypothetical protein
MRMDIAPPMFAAAASGRGNRRAPLSQSRNASQWIAATIFKVTSGGANSDGNHLLMCEIRCVAP